MHGKMPFKMHTIIFSEKNNIKICVSTSPKLSEMLTETHLFFDLAYGFCFIVFSSYVDFVKISAFFKTNLSGALSE